MPKTGMNVFAALMGGALSMFSITFQANGQGVCIESYLTGDILSIAEDDQHLWLATAADGLIYFDKSTLQGSYFNTDNSNLPADRIKSVLFHGNRLFLSLDSSLLSLNNGIFQMENDSIEGILTEDPFGNLLVTGRRNFYILHAGEITYAQNLMEFVPDACCSDFTDVAVDSSGNIWLTRYDFYEFDILRYHGFGWTRFDDQNSVLPFESFQTNGIIATQDAIYATNWSGLYRYKNEEWQIIHSQAMPTILDGLDSIHSPLTAIELDRGGVIWLGTNGSSWGQPAEVAYGNEGNWKIISDFGPESFRTNIIFPSPLDSNLIYLGTDHGLKRIDKSCLATTTAINHVNETSVQFYPNPALEQLNIDWGGLLNGKYDLKVYDILGKLVFLKKNISDQIFSLPLYTFQNSQYYFLIQKGKETIHRKVNILK